MKINIVYLLLIALLGLTVSASIAQQNQNVPKTDPEVEKLKKRVSELEEKLKTVENVEKMELAAKLADAHAKLLETEFDKLKLELKDSNQQWLITWIIIFLAFLSAGGLTLWSRLTKKMDDLIATEVEKSLDGFQNAVEQVRKQKDELRRLKKEHTALVLKDHVHLRDSQGNLYTDTINALPNDGLLDLIIDETYGLDFRYKAAEVLAVRNNPKLVSPVLELLNCFIDSKISLDEDFSSQRHLHGLVYVLGCLHFQESYEGLKSFFNRLISENHKNKDLFLPWTVFSLAEVSMKLDIKDSKDMLRKVVPDLKELEQNSTMLNLLIEYFNKFQEYEGIKEILTNGFAENMPDVEEKCLELLEKHDPDFVNQWKEKKEDTNTEGETNEPEPTE